MVARVGTILFLALMALSVGIRPIPAEDQTTISGIASWYSYESARSEGSTGIMYNGQRMRNDQLTAACWYFPIGAYVEVIRTDDPEEPPRTVLCKITDRGPSKKLKDRVIDLSPIAFLAIGDLDEGLVEVKVRRID